MEVPLFDRRIRKTRVAPLLAVLLFTLPALVAKADVVTFTINIPNSAISGYPAPYAEVSVTSNAANTATITVTGDTNSGYQYLLGDSGSFAFNSSISGLTFSNFSWTGGKNTGGNPTGFTATGSGTEDGFGLFTYTFDNNDGFGDAVTSLTFDVSGTFADAAALFTPNKNGNTVAAHIFVNGLGANQCTDSNGAVVACATGFASQGAQPAPEPASLVLLGSGLLTLGACFRRKIGS